MNYSDDSIQSYCASWWEKKERKDFQVGRLVWLYFPYFSLIPYELIAEERSSSSGRNESTEHRFAQCRITQMRIKEKHVVQTLPISGLSVYGNERYLVTKAKKRPALILPNNIFPIDQNLTKNRPKWQSHSSILVAPYYGAVENGKRSGFSSTLIKRVQHCEYPQFMYDMLPIPNSETKESLLFFSHLVSVGRHHDAVEPTEFCLSEEGIEILKEYMEWFLLGRLDPESILLDFRDGIEEYEI